MFTFLMKFRKREVNSNIKILNYYSIIVVADGPL